MLLRQALPHQGFEVDCHGHLPLSETGRTIRCSAPLWDVRDEGALFNLDWGKTMHTL
jgi:hypothetical protein